MAPVAHLLQRLIALFLRELVVGRQMPGKIDHVLVGFAVYNVDGKGLATIEGVVAKTERAGGHPPGYRRCSRALCVLSGW